MKGGGKAHRTLELIESAHQILAEIQPASVRAVCYRLFTAGVIDSMSKANTNKVSAQLTWAREQGIIPWSWIVDETREGRKVGRSVAGTNGVPAAHAYPQAEPSR